MITGLYASFLALLFLVLSVYVIRGRLALRVSLGDGGQRDLERRIRAHANFSEYVPLALILLYISEQSGLAGWALHALGAALLVGRLLHAFALIRPNVIPYARQAGMVLTFTMIIIPALYLLVRAL